MKTDKAANTTRTPGQFVQEMITPECNPEWQNCINGLSFGKCPIHGDGMTDAQRMEADHEDALECNRGAR